MAHILSSRLSKPFCPGTAGLSQPASRPVRTRLARAAVANDDPPASKDGILPGIAQWPPTPITEHGQPNPEDDPNPDANSGGGKTLNAREAVAGPPLDEEKKQGIDPKKSAVSEPVEQQQTGTQQGGGGEGSAS